MTNDSLHCHSIQGLLLFLIISLFKAPMYFFHLLGFLNPFIISLLFHFLNTFSTINQYKIG
nr:MAG TPA: hypothetical protein [Bacteriophage sp.]